MPGFWWQASQKEIELRTQVDEQIRRLIAGQPGQWTPLLAWLYQRRVEFAGTVILMKARQKIEPAEEFPELLDRLLIGLWAEHGWMYLRKQAFQQSPTD